MNDIWTTVKAGKILKEELIIDCHSHMGPWFNFSIPKDSWAEGMIFAMDTCGINMAASAPHIGMAADIPWANDIIADVVRKYPDRFLGYCAVNPNYPEKEMVAELEKYITNGNLHGIKIHPALHDYSSDGPNYKPMWEFANEREEVVLVHTWESSPICGPLMFKKIGKEFPKAKILLGHSGGPVKGIDQAIEAATETENLFLDLTGSSLPRGMLEVMVDKVGSDRVLFGTDIPFVDCRAKIGYIAMARLSDDDKRKIFGLNAKTLFKL